MRTHDGERDGTSVIGAVSGVRVRSVRLGEGNVCHARVAGGGEGKRGASACSGLDGRVGWGEVKPRSTERKKMARRESSGVGREDNVRGARERTAAPGSRSTDLSNGGGGGGGGGGRS
jgi:hypothetical protein